MPLPARIIVKLVAAGAATVFAATAHAADTTRYVSMTGSNDNDCTLAAPCRTVQRGINTTPARGELRILESGDYGSKATVTKAMTITGNGNTVLLSGGVIVDAPGAVVTLRGLTLSGEGTPADGITIMAAATVHIERCTVHGFGDDGIRATASGIEVIVLDSISRDHGGNGFYIFAGTESRVTVDNSRFDNNGGAGIAILSGRAAVQRATVSVNASNNFTIANATVTAMWTVATQGQFAGFAVGTASTLTLEFSLSHGNGGYGLQIGSGGTARLSNSTITGNASAINNNGTLQSRVNNNVSGSVLGTAKVSVSAF